MSPEADELLRRVMELPEEERAEFGEAVLASVEPEHSFWTPEFVAELDRRRARVESGESKLSTWDEVRERAWKRLREQLGG